MVRQILLLTALTALPFGCSSSDDRGGGAEGTDPNSFPLAGVWNGSANSSLEGSELTNASAVLKLTTEGQDTGGKFELSIPDIENAQATGTFQDFMSQSILFTITASNISSFGLNGVSTFDYEITGDALLLSNNRMKLYLLREGEAPDNSGNEDGSSNNSGHRLSGTWECLTEVGTSWIFKITAEGYKGNVKERATYFSGRITNKDNDNLLLEGDSSSDEPFDRYVFLMTANTDINAKMVATKRGDSGSSQLTCSKF